MPDLRTVMQRTLTALAESERARQIVGSPVAGREVLNRYLAGEDDSALVEVAEYLAERNRALSINRLVEPPTDPAGVVDVVDGYLGCVAALVDGGIERPGWIDMSVTLPSLGWGAVVDDQVVEQLRRLVTGASERGASVTVVAEDTLGRSGPEDVLPLVGELRKIEPRTGVGVHASLRRTEADCRRLSSAGARVVLLKGRHADAEGFHRRRAAVDQSYVRCLRVLMEGDGYPVVATNDARLLRLTQALAEYVGRTPDTFEYQVRYGVRPETQAVIADRGDQLRVYTPYGPDWYPYIVARIANQPENLVSFWRHGRGR